MRYTKNIRGLFAGGQRALTALALCIALLGAVCPALSAAGESAAAFTVQSALAGNTGAVLIASQPILSAETDSDLVALSLSEDGKHVTVTAHSGAIGVAAVTLTGEAGSAMTEVPVGYTTFAFDGDSLTVFEGESNKYELLAINAAGEEDTPTAETDANGNAVYRNSGNRRLCVEIKKSGGTFVFCGQGEDMSLSVKKEATDPAALLLAGLDLTSSFTAPLTVKKDSASTVTVTALAGYENTLTDAAFNNADLYGAVSDGGSGENAEYAESAVIKAKTAARLTLNGGGVLNLVCHSKNAVKVGASGSLTVENLTLRIRSDKHGLSSDNTLLIRSGTLDITAAEDALRSDPDAVDAAGGTAGCITVEGGALTLNAGEDGVQAAQDLTVTGGEWSVTAGGKGLKASCGDEEAETTTNVLTVTGGRFTLDTADDALHSDADIRLSGGVFAIATGDDGVHADSVLQIGTPGGDNAALTIDISRCYEGLEGSEVTICSGTISVVAADDGINAAGGSDAADNPGQGFRPGGMRPGTMWGGGTNGAPGASSAVYTLDILGGDIFVNASGDGLDSNGSLTLSGGTLVVWGMAAGGDNEPLDCDGALTIDGATVFAAGSAGMITTPRSSQPYVTSRAAIPAGQTVQVQYNGETVYQTVALKRANYVLYSSPDMTSADGWSITAAETPDEPDIPDTPDTPNIPNTPDVPDVPDTPDDPAFLPGDVNGDGSVDTTDARLTLQYAARRITASDLSLAAADVNGDGTVNTTDARLILQYAARRIAAFSAAD